MRDAAGAPRRWRGASPAACKAVPRRRPPRAGRRTRSRRARTARFRVAARTRPARTQGRLRQVRQGFGAWLRPSVLEWNRSRSGFVQARDAARTVQAARPHDTAGRGSVADAGRSAAESDSSPAGDAERDAPRVRPSAAGTWILALVFRSHQQAPPEAACSGGCSTSRPATCRGAMPAAGGSAARRSAWGTCCSTPRTAAGSCSSTFGSPPCARAPC